jgi:predicted DNA binding CopG/RHH family protein
MSKARRAAPKPVPHFASEDEERRFWATHDATDYFDWSRAVEPTFPNLKPSTTAISLRLPVTMLEELKSLANARDVPYQSLLKVFLADRLTKESASRRRPGAGSRVAERARRGYPRGK